MKNKKLIVVSCLIALLFISCNKKVEKMDLKTGVWRGELTMQAMQLPFNFGVQKQNNKYSISLKDGGETLELSEVKVKGDSVFIKLHIFDIDIKAKIIGETLSGVYTKNYVKDYQLPFKATFGLKTRFDNPSSNKKFDGKWQTTFTDDKGKSYPAIGVLRSDGNEMKGTFLTTTGDYRYLEGFANGNKMTLYAFDGNHAFIFKASIQNDSIIHGDFYSGKSWHETFKAIKNENASLPSSLKLTYLKKGYDKIDFSFPSLDGHKISPNDKKYKGKVLILQIFGTWCPNCMDETRFLSKWYHNNKKRGVEIIGLAYEAKPDFNYAKSRVEKVKKQMNVEYDYVIAGTYDKDVASKSLPMLNKIISFPTSIIIDKHGKVRRIHTGFSGPATGEYYEKYKDDFNNFINKLLAEK